MDAIELTWPGGTHPFRLPLGRIRAVEQVTNAGIEEIFNRLRQGTWRADDLVATIRQGLVGGGMPDNEARELVLKTVDLYPLGDFKLVTAEILRHALFMPTDDQPGKDEGAETAPVPEN